MNELIKQLIEQAHVAKTKKVIKGGWDNDREPFEYNSITESIFDKEKFAELIVRECINSTLSLQNIAINNNLDTEELFRMIVDHMLKRFDMQHVFIPTKE